MAATGVKARPTLKLSVVPVVAPLVVRTKSPELLVNGEAANVIEVLVTEPLKVVWVPSGKVIVATALPAVPVANKSVTLVVTPDVKVSAAPVNAEDV
jgi:hypothetical protein